MSLIHDLLIRWVAAQGTNYYANLFTQPGLSQVKEVAEGDMDTSHTPLSSHSVCVCSSSIIHSQIYVYLI